MSMKISVSDENGKLKILIETESKGKTLLSILQENQVYIDAPCNGKGTCGKCKVKYSAGAEREKVLLSACQVIPDGDCTVQLVNTEDRQIQAVTGYERIQEADAADSHAHDKTDAADLYLNSGAAGYGIAIDIGTTTLAAALVHLPTGTREGVITSVNHQRMYGADVITRIQAANEGKLQLLQKSLYSDLRQMVTALLAKAHIAMYSVSKIVIAGNTAMCHFLLGYSCRTLGVAPFQPFDISLTKKKYQTTEVVILPGISAFLGADIVSGLYAGGLAERKEDTLFLDIGTNGEMVIGNTDGFLGAATAAGPVFEGGEISCGVPGVTGAISHISLNEDASVRHVERIGGGTKTIGLCGSGIIDMVGELVRNHLVDTEGLLKEPWFTEGISVGNDCFRFLQSDIRKFQMGKAAIRTGIEILLNRYYGRHKIPSRICLAGGFGYYMNIDSAIRTGLLPPDFEGRVEILGNSALEGAIRCLIEDAEALTAEIVRKTEVINLAEEEDFSYSYVEYMRFE